MKYQKKHTIMWISCLKNMIFGSKAPFFQLKIVLSFSKLPNSLYYI